MNKLLKSKTLRWEIVTGISSLVIGTPIGFWLNHVIYAFWNAIMSAWIASYDSREQAIIALPSYKGSPVMEVAIFAVWIGLIMLPWIFVRLRTSLKIKLSFFPYAISLGTLPTMTCAIAGDTVPVWMCFLFISAVIDAVWICFHFISWIIKRLRNDR